MLSFHPNHRITMKQALHHSYFHNIIESGHMEAFYESYADEEKQKSYSLNKSLKPLTFNLEKNCESFDELRKHVSTLFSFFSVFISYCFCCSGVFIDNRRTCLLSK
jgi:hypothetical protein